MGWKIEKQANGKFAIYSTRIDDYIVIDAEPLHIAQLYAEKGVKVYLASEPGTISVLASQAEWKVISTHELHEKIYATPAFGMGCIFVRTEQALYSFQAPVSP